MNLTTTLLDRGLIPDSVIRFGIRRFLARRLESEWSRSPLDAEERRRVWVARLSQQGIASEPELAKEQHYEVPSRFFELVLGPRLKYSSSFWLPGTERLASAEESMLELTTERADVKDGQRILDLGCGWGSLSLWMAERFPSSEIIAVSNSRSQGHFILDRAAELGLQNIRHLCANVEDLQPRFERFDRIVSIEMFEHMRNYHLLLERIASWLEEDGRLFVHIFCHQKLTYPFEDPTDDATDDWMARHFFRGGLMPAADLLPAFQSAMEVEDQWIVSGQHYQQTAEAWLANFDQAKDEIRQLFESSEGEHQAEVWLNRWRVFFMSCAELFGYDSGNQWKIAHYRFRRSG